MNIEIKRNGNEVVAIFENMTGDICHLGLGNVIDKTDAECIILAEEQIAINEDRKNNPLPPSYKELRSKEYPPIDEMIVALWEDIVEKRPQARIDLQVKREAVKVKYPKG